METDLLQQVCAIPTAPFAEGRVFEFVERFVADRPKLRLSADAFGNRLIELPGEPSLPRFVFTAHTDHPGFVAARMVNERTLDAYFRGYVLASYFKTRGVTFYDGERSIAAEVISTSGGTKRRPVPTRARLRVADPVAAGAPGLWDLTFGRKRGKRFESRACDDLAGAAAALQMLDILSSRPPRSTIGLLLTRAEEEGFIGAVAASLRPKLLQKSDRLIAIECSAMQPYAPQGEGAIVRVGDRTSIFNSSLTWFLSRQADLLARRDKTFRYQRALMPGGTCEATVYDVYGFHAASICVPLGNYHNMDTKARRIAPEFIDLNDWKSMVKLFVQVARAAHDYDPSHGVLKMRIEKRYRSMERLLTAKKGK